MAVNKPRGTMRARARRRNAPSCKTKLGGASAWTRRNKKSGEFMAVRKDQGREKVQGRAAGEVRRSDTSDRPQTSLAIAADKRSKQPDHAEQERPGRSCRLPSDASRNGWGRTSRCCSLVLSGRTDLICADDGPRRLQGEDGRGSARSGSRT
jgi:hypothetical protein